MKNILAKTLVIMLIAIIPSLGLFNGHYQETIVEIEGITGTCYGTLLSKSPGSGGWNTKDDHTPTYAPDSVKEAFKEYTDPDGYYYYNYFQDVSAGLLQWTSYPPENFKVLLYFEDTDTFMSTESAKRYSLASPYKVQITNDGLILKKNYDYITFILKLLLRILISAGLASLVSLFYCKRHTYKPKRFIITNIIFHVLVNIYISVFSFYHGFTIVEYISTLWAPYLIFVVAQCYFYNKTTDDIQSSFVIATAADITVYGLGVLLVDNIPSLFM
ncbi:MAG: hypothetical protein J5928_04720 [Firmicutes bacterium]|nr:hypothetical protein [Bacillota bacterium]